MAAGRGRWTEGGGGAAARRGRGRRAAGWRAAGGALLRGGRGPARRLLRRAVRERPRRARRGPGGRRAPLLGLGVHPPRRRLPAIPRGRAGCGDGSAGAADGGGRGGLAARSALLRDTDLGALDDEELDAHITRALA